MKLLLISPEYNYKKEADYVNRFFEMGLQDYHIRKPNTASDTISMLISKIAVEYHSRIVIHQSHELMDQWQLKGVHYTEKERAKGEYTTGFKSTGLHLPFPPYQEAIGFDRILISPVFDSISKEGYQAQAIEGFIPDKAIEQYAMAGITPDRIKICAQMGFDGVAVLGYVWQNNTPLNALEELIKACQ